MKQKYLRVFYNLPNKKYRQNKTYRYLSFSCYDHFGISGFRIIDLAGLHKGLPGSMRLSADIAQAISHRSLELDLPHEYEQIMRRMRFRKKSGEFTSA